jgi:hypothetical protein
VFVAPDEDDWENATETAKLTASDGAAGDGFGSAVSVSGNTVVAGSSAATVGPNAGQGAAYVFVEPSSGWTSATETAKLTASDGGASDGFGSSVSVSPNTVVAGAPSGTVGTNAGQGAAYVFVKPSSGWTSVTETAKLTSSDGVTGDAFGSSVSVSGNTLVAGAPSAAGPPPAINAGQGAAYVFVKPSSGWKSGTETAKLTASDGAAADGLGSSVAALPYGVLAGAPGATVGSNSYQGAAYVFVRPRNGWKNATETAKLIASDGAAGDQLGSAVSAWGLTGVAGAPGATVGGNSRQGAVYVFGK